MTNESVELCFLKFGLGAMTGALPLAYAREVLPMAELIRPPRLVPTVEGLLNLGGTSYPVLRLDRLLGLETTEPTPGVNPDGHLILTRGLELTCVLMVDRVLGVERVGVADVRPIQGFVTTSACVTTQYFSGTTAVHVLDLSTLLASPARALKVVTGVGA